ncbi:multiple sugar-binding protein precursor [mine drainage metagenome]|uniref:Multiple sugar-binding protein n=1 Tax=mine drainage metagenome TaxID=410659 RepID=A0A1J5QAT3_9ZZZZ
MHMKTLTSTLLASTLLAGSAAWAQTTLTIESWRNDDLTVWQQTIIPAFEKAHPDITVVFAPSAPTEYNAALNSKLDAGSAGDLITCRPFDASLALFQKGKLADLSSMAEMANFSDVAKAAWQTDDAKHTFCMPMASVIHGFIYNKDAFDKLGLTPPKTMDEFYADLDKIKKNGTFTPLAMGTHDQWEAATMGYENIGPNYWKGEEGRKAIIAGTAKLTDPQFVEPFTQLAKWGPYMGDGFQAQTYPDSQNLFTLGRAAIYPAGSWEISGFEKQAAFKMAAFPAPVPKAGDPCYISDQPDHALGLNAASKNKDAAMTFLKWVGSEDFAAIYGNALPGFFPLVDKPVKIADPLANEMLSWRQTCKSTMRYTYQILSRGTPNLENALWATSANVINGTQTPQAAAAEMQKDLATWYKPQQ